MNLRASVTCAIVAGLGSLGAAADSHAQYATYYRPIVAYYAPPAVVAPPVVVAPRYVAASPVVVTAAAPVVAAPAAVVAYPSAPAVAYAPVQQVVTRYRPLLGRTVSRVRYSYMPVVLP